MTTEGNMDLLPAIDLKDGKVVRLTRGDYAQVKVYSDDVLAVVRQWIDAGAEWIHLVDLDAALLGKPVNTPLLQQMAELLSSAGKKMEIGGGIREEISLRYYLETLKFSRVILGTVSYENPDFVRQACLQYPGKIAVGIDIKAGKVATHGWTVLEERPPLEFAQQFKEMGVSCIVYTDVQRDGMLSGLNFEGIGNFVAQSPLPIVVAGGLRDLNDVKRLSELRSDKILGAITGKAIYEGTLDLKDALAWMKSQNKNLC